MNNNDIFTKKSGNIYPSILFVALIVLISIVYLLTTFFDKNNKVDNKKEDLPKIEYKFEDKKLFIDGVTLPREFENVEYIGQIKDILVFRVKERSTIETDSALYDKIVVVKKDNVGKNFNDETRVYFSYFETLPIIKNVKIEKDTVIVSSNINYDAICNYNNDTKVSREDKYDYEHISDINAFGKNIKSYMANTGKTVKEYKLSNNIKCTQDIIDNNSIKNGEKKELTIGGITRTVERKECKTYIDGNLIFEDTLDCTGDIYVLFDNLIVMSENEGVAFYNANLEKINYVMDPEYINVKMTKKENSDDFVPIIMQNDKVVVEGSNRHLTAPMANIDGKSYDICVEENGKRHLNPVFEGKLASAKYELTYKNNELVFNRISGTEYYYTEDMCK